MQPSSTDVENQESARLIYKRATRQAQFICFPILVLLFAVGSFLSEFVFHFKGGVGVVAGLSVGMTAFIHRYASEKVKKAGLSRERIETESITKKFARFEAEPLVYKPEKGMKFAVCSWSGISLLLLVLVWSRWDNLWPLRWFDWLWLGVLGYVWCLSLYFIRYPVALRLDESGIYAMLDNNLWPRRVKWEKIADLEVKRSFDYTGKVFLWQLNFRDASGNAILKGTLNLLWGDREQNEALIDALKDKFRSADILG